MKNKFTISFFAAAFCFVIMLLNANAQNLTGTSTSMIMLQGFDGGSCDRDDSAWWAQVELKATTIGSKFDMVWLPPSGQATDKKGYLVRNYYYHGGAYGTESALKSVIKKLQANNVKVLADVVLNHRSGNSATDWCEFDWKKDATGTWVDAGWSGACVCNDDDENDGYLAAKCSPTGAADEGVKYAAARDLDHNNALVKADIKDYLKYIKTEYGYDGYRLDMVHGYAGKHVNDYLTAAPPVFSVGENFPSLSYSGSDINQNQNGARQVIVDWITATGSKSAAFDIPLKGLLTEVFKNGGALWKLKDTDGKPNGIHGWMPNNSVTFVDNHDTGPAPNENRWPMDTYNVAAAYAYILTHPGVPCVFWDHYFEVGTLFTGVGAQIDKLIAVRKGYGIKSDATVVISNVAAGLYSAYINSNVAVKIGWDSWSPTGTGWAVAASGNNYCVWTKGNPVTVTVDADKASGTYIGGTNVTLTASSGSGSGYSIYYTTDGSTPVTTGVTNTNKLYSSAIAVTVNNTVLKVIAKDGAGNISDVKTYTYVTEAPKPFNVFFNKTTFDEAHIWSWNADGNIVAGVWPGPAMTAVDGVAGWYYYTITGAATADIIFANKAGSTQTPTFTGITSETCFNESSKITCPVWTSIEVTPENQVRAYFSPMSDELIITGVSNMKKVEITNLVGQTVYAHNIAASVMHINATDYNKGIYFVSLYDNNGNRTTKKIVKR